MSRMIDPKDALIAGEATLGRVLAPRGFRFRITNSAKGSGGPFAQAEFFRDDRYLELHFRYGLGLVRYHIGSDSASHESYMRELGVESQCQYPGFSKHPLASFEHLAHDMSFAEDFVSGSGQLLITASRKEAIVDAERQSASMARYVGDTRKLEQLHDNFKNGNFSEVVKLADSLKFPERMKDSEREMVKIARRKKTTWQLFR